MDPKEKAKIETQARAAVAKAISDRDALVVRLEKARKAYSRQSEALSALERKRADLLKLIDEEEINNLSALADLLDTNRPIANRRSFRDRRTEVTKLDDEVAAAETIFDDIRKLIRKTDLDLGEASVEISRRAHDVILPSIGVIFERVTKLTEMLAEHRLLLQALDNRFTPVDLGRAMETILINPFPLERERRLGLFPEWAEAKSALEGNPNAPLPPLPV